MVFVEGVVSPVKCSLEPYLQLSLPDYVQIQDPSLPVLSLLRVLNAINRYWSTLYPTQLHNTSIIPFNVSTIIRKYLFYKHIFTKYNYILF